MEIKKVKDALGADFDAGFTLVNGIYHPVAASLNEGEVKTPFYRFADLNGDGSGVYDAIGNYSGAPTPFYIQPAADEILRILRVVVFIRDSGSFKASGYGSVGGDLTNGIKVEVVDNSGTLIDLTAQESIVTNAGWGSYCYDVDVKTWGTGDEVLLCRWTFGKAGFPLRLVGDNNERLEFILNDDFTFLVHHAFHCQGFYE